MGRKFLNIKVGIKLKSLLSRESLFQGDGKKAISGCEFLMRLIVRYSLQNTDGWAKIRCKTLDNLFRPYKVKYLDVLAALEKLEIMHPRKVGFYDRTSRSGSVSQYRLTDFGVMLLIDKDREYLRKGQNDLKVDRRIRNTLSKRKSRIKDSEDLVISKTAENILDLKLDRAGFEEYWENMDCALSYEEYYQKQYPVIEIVTKKFKKLKRCETDGRIHHPWVRMKSDLRPLFSLRGKIYSLTLDIRSCHPTFWGKYICDLIGLTKFLVLNEEKREELDTKYNNKLNTSDIYNSIYQDSISISPISSVPPVSLHYLTCNVDKIVEEYVKWTKFWTDPHLDPKQQIIADLGGAFSRDEVKDLINSSINGKENQVFKWIENNYPVLFEIWNQTNLKTTGPQISKFYETKIMLDPELILLAESLGLDVISEHDGFAGFAAEGDPDVDQKAQALAARIGDNCLRLFGFRAVVKVKRVGGGD
jgi:hypothetical protein